MFRDFTYINNTVDALIKIILKDPSKRAKNYKINQPHNSNCNFKIFNIGNNRKTKLLDFLKIIEKLLNKKAKIKYDKI